jgi:acetyl esterase
MNPESHMPLHPQAVKFLSQLAALKLPPTEESTPAEARDWMRASIPGLGPPEAVASVEDRSIPGPAGKISVRIYRSAAANKPCPAVVFFHGGGWVVGDLDTHDGLCRALCNAARCVVMSVDYRLAPEHKYPAAAEDAYAATIWIREHAAVLDVDPRRVAVAGDSAGGNLAAATALMTRDRGQPPLAAQVLIYPIADGDFETPSYQEFADGYMLTRGAMKWFFRQYLSGEHEAQEPYVCPAQAANLRGLPPALVITAEYDPLRDEAEAYARRLQAAGVPSQLTRYDGMVHGFLRRLNMFDAARVALSEVSSFLSVAFNSKTT